MFIIDRNVPRYLIRYVIYVQKRNKNSNIIERRGGQAYMCSVDISTLMSKSITVYQYLKWILNVYPHFAVLQHSYKTPHLFRTAGRYHPKCVFHILLFISARFRLDKSDAFDREFRHGGEMPERVVHSLVASLENYLMMD